ncbi:bile acid:sodium symporter [Bacillus sp. CGMCC 1.16541]|uniref:bile acid:sodium symporter family protein n=1 Tax=Bacillus sp. CGMCC 1.16541 TaxID=2185143 RepID=UPI000D72B7D8|nr:bile acid:sodium symporter [Bacillus sp. CGMCC 1.16541]
MNQLNEFLSRKLPLLILLMAIGTYVSPYHLNVPSSVPSLLLGVVIFFTGLSMNVNAIKQIHTKKRELFLATLLKWTLTVFLSIGLAYAFFSHKPDLAAGIILSGVVPSATAATLYTFLAGGTTPLVISASLVDIFISPIVTPLSMMGLSSQEVSISIWSLLQSFFFIVLLPLGAGLLVQRMIPTLVTHSKSVTKLGSSVALLLIIHTLVGSGKDAISSEIGSMPLLAAVTFVQVIGPMLLAYYIAKILNVQEADARAILFQVGLCNTALAAILAFEFISELAAIAPIVNMIFNLSLGALFANHFAKKEEREATLAS